MTKIALDNQWIVQTHRNRFQNSRDIRRRSLPFHKEVECCNPDNLVKKHPWKDLIQACRGTSGNGNLCDGKQEVFS